jgi:hypothetical protein
LLGATACTTTDPYSSAPNRNNTGTGAIAGALGGALLGYLTNTSNSEQGRKNALIGAGIGALGGAAVGQYMDRQQRDLEAELSGSGVGVARQGDNLVLRMPSDVTFATNQSNINPRFDATLDDVAAVLQDRTTSRWSTSSATPTPRRRRHQPAPQRAPRLFGRRALIRNVACSANACTSPGQLAHADRRQRHDGGPRPEPPGRDPDPPVPRLIRAKAGVSEEEMAQGLRLVAVAVVSAAITATAVIGAGQLWIARSALTPPPAAEQALLVRTAG